MTESFGYGKGWEYISTHTPAWGVTERRNILADGAGDFNSHARVGRDCS